MKKSKILSAALFAAALVSLSSCGKTKFEPFDVKDTGPKIWLQSGINQLENGDFSQEGTHWGTFLTSGGSGTPEYSDGRVNIKIKNPGSVNYGVQFYYDGFRIYHDGKYTLSFRASADNPKGCEVRIQLNGGDYHPYVVDTFTFTQEEKEYVLDFTMTDETDMMPRLAFNMGDFPDRDGGELPTTVTIRDVRFILNNTIAEEESSNGGADIVRVNQIGFRPGDKKLAYVKVTEDGQKFTVLDSNKTVVLKGSLGKPVRDELAYEYVATADFSSLKNEGIYSVKVGDSESFPFAISKNPYSSLVQDALRFFTLSRCGCEVSDSVYGHPACHTGRATIVENLKKIDIVGGWHDAGDYGRYVVPAAKSVADLLFAYENFDGGVDFDILDEVKWETDWLLQMQKSDGGVYHKITCSSFPEFVMPEEETATQFVSNVSTAATADFAGTLALSSVYYRKTDSEYADRLLDAATKAWNYLEENEYRPFSNIAYISTGEYPDKSDADERFFAAASLALATGEDRYSQAAEKIRSESSAKWSEQFGWEQMEGYADHIILKNQKLFPQNLVKDVKAAVKKYADEALANTLESGFNQAQKTLNWGSNMEAMNLSHLLSLAGETFSNKKYTQAAQSQIDYVLGANPLSRCYVTGYGSNPPVHPHHRPSIAKDQPQKGMLVGGPDQNLEDEFAGYLLADKPPLMCHIDNYQSYSTNEITIYWNSALVYAISALCR